MSINTAGVIVGTAYTQADLASPIGFGQEGRAFLWREGTLTDLNTLIAPNSGWTLLEARDINNAGWIAANARYNGGDYAVLLIPATEQSRKNIG